MVALVLTDKVPTVFKTRWWQREGGTLFVNSA